MHPLHEYILQSRRNFLATSASGIGTLALALLLKDDGLLAAESVLADATNPLALKLPHFAPKAKACICIYLEGAPSQIDLFDLKPKLKELNGQKLPDSMTKNVRFAFIQKEGARLMGSPRPFKKYGLSGMELSDFLPHLATCVDDMAFIRSMHTEAFNHHPGQLMMNTGVPTFGRPSWARGLIMDWAARQRTCQVMWSSPPAAAPAAEHRTGRAASCQRPTRASSSATRVSQC